MFSLAVYRRPADGWYGHIDGCGEELPNQPQANNWIMFIDTEGACFFYRRNPDGSVIEDSKQVFDPRNILETSKPGPIPDGLI